MTALKFCARERGYALALLLSLPALYFGWLWHGLLASGWSSALGANPVEATLHESGLWAIRLLLLALAVSPAAKYLHMAWLARHRRMIGLFSFGYATIHLLLFVGLDQGFNLAAIVSEIVKRWYLTLGLLAWLALLPLAVTSTRGWMMRLKKGWRRLHMAIYPIAILAMIHYLMVGKVTSQEQWIMVSLLVGLLGLRVLDWLGAALKPWSPPSRRAPGRDRQPLASNR